MAESQEGCLEEYYKTTFLLINKHKFSLTELENLLPYEKDIYVYTLMADLEKQKEK
jgi:hypothetical protein